MEGLDLSTKKIVSILLLQQHVKGSSRLTVVARCLYHEFQRN